MYRVRQKIWEVKINNPVQGSKYTLYKKGIEIKEHKILGVSDSYICLDNSYFTKFDLLEKGKSRESYHSYIDNILVTIKTNETLFENGIFLKLYSSKKPTKRTFNKMVAKAAIEIEKKYGFLSSGAKNELYEMVENFKK